MYARFVDSFLINTISEQAGYYYYDNASYSYINFRKLTTDSRTFAAKLKNESKGNAAIERTILKTKKGSAKTTLLHCVPNIYDMAFEGDDKRKIFILPTDYDAFRKEAGEHSYVGLDAGASFTKKAADHFKEQMAAFYEVMLEPFKKTSTELYFLLKAQDDKYQRTPVHEAVAQVFDKSILKPLLDRIASTAEPEGTLTAEQKEEIALIPDKFGRTLYHDLLYRFPTESLRWVANTFHPDVFKKALTKTNKREETPLHHLCNTYSHRADKAKYIRELLTEVKGETEGVEYKMFTPSVEKMFPQRREDKANPLHLACQKPARDVKEDVAFIAEMKTILGGSLFTKKMEEKDSNNSTPLDYALSPRNVKGDNVLLAREILVNLVPAEMKHILALHTACQYKNSLDDAEFFQRLVKNFGDLYPTAVFKQDILGNTPLHYATTNPASTALVEEILKHLTPEQQKALVLVKNKEEKTALELACQNGDQRMLEIIIHAIGPAEFFAACKHKKLKEVVKKSKSNRLSEAEFDRIVKRYTSLFRLIEYHTTFSHRHLFKDLEDQDQLDRRADTQGRLQAIKNGQPQPVANPKFAAHERGWGLWTSSQEYYDLCKDLLAAYEKDPASITKEYNECRKFFLNPSNLTLLDMHQYDFSIIERLFVDINVEESKKTQEVSVSLSPAVPVASVVPPIAYATALPLPSSFAPAPFAEPIEILAYETPIVSEGLYSSFASPLEPGMVPPPIVSAVPVVVPAETRKVDPVPPILVATATPVVPEKTITYSHDPALSPSTLSRLSMFGGGEPSSRLVFAPVNLAGAPEAPPVAIAIPTPGPVPVSAPVVKTTPRTDLSVHSILASAPPAPTRPLDNVNDNVNAEEVVPVRSNKPGLVVV